MAAVAGVTGALLAVAEEDGYKRAPIWSLLRAAPSDLRFIHPGTGFLRTAPMGYHRTAGMGYSTQHHRAAPHRLYVHGRASLSAARFLRPASAEVPRPRKKNCSSTPPENTNEEPNPKAYGRLASLKAWPWKLIGNIIKLILLGVSIWIGFQATKNHQMATYIVDVSDKSHKVYNIASKAFLIVAEILKGDDK